MKYIFESYLGSYIEEFIKAKHKAGFSYKREVHHLKGFDQYCHQHSLSVKDLQREKILIYFDRKQSECTGSHYARICVIKQFLYYLNSRGIETYIPIQKAPKTKRLPFLMTDIHLQSFFKILDAEPPKSKLNYKLLFRLLCTTGLRISEALNLKLSDFDAEKGCLTILNSKGNKDRLVYLSEDMTLLLSQFCKNKKAEYYIFPGHKLEKKHCYSSIARRFNEIWLKTGFYVENGKNPTVHSLRHYYVTKRINLWAEQGIPLNNMLICLANQLGHSSPNETFYYFHLIEDSLKVISKKDITGKKIMEDINE